MPASGRRSLRLSHLSLRRARAAHLRAAPPRAHGPLLAGVGLLSAAAACSNAPASARAPAPVPARAATPAQVAPGPPALAAEAATPGDASASPAAGGAPPEAPAPSGRAFNIALKGEMCHTPEEGWRSCGEAAGPRVALTKAQHNQLDALLSDRKNFQKSTVSCFTPHHVFERPAEGGQAPYVIVCFDCDQVFVSGPPSPPGKATKGDMKTLTPRGRKAFQGLCRDVGLNGCDAPS